MDANELQAFTNELDAEMAQIYKDVEEKAADVKR